MSSKSWSANLMGWLLVSKEAMLGLVLPPSAQNGINLGKKGSNSGKKVNT